MNISVFGCGYVGLVTAAGLASLGHIVTGIDTDKEKIQRLIQGQIPIYEPGLEPIVQKVLNKGQLKFTADYQKAVEDSVAIFITVGTPPKQEDGSADLSQVESVAKTIGAYMNSYKVIIDKSTVPVGTARRVQKIVQENLKSPMRFSVVSNPEFLREGSAVVDFMHPDRVVVGAESEEAKAVMAEMYRPFMLAKTPIIWTNLETAELIKYASNGFLATKITYINELSHLCEAVGADVLQVAKGMGSDHRIGPDFLMPGPGYGGSCFPKDTRALLATAYDHNLSLSIVEATVKANDYHKQTIAEKIHKTIGDLKGKTIAILGLAFKADTDDMRESPSIPVIQELIEAGAKINAHDPAAFNEAQAIFDSSINYIDDLYEAVKEADAIVILTEWGIYRELKLEQVKELVKKPIIIDLRNMLDPSATRQLGFHYVGLGRLERM